MQGIASRYWDSHVQQDVSARENVAQFHSKFVFMQYEQPYETISEQIEGSERVLDWGCGSGHFSHFLLANFDITSTMYGFERGPVVEDLIEAGCSFVSGGSDGDPQDPVTLPFDDSSFDVIFSCGVLEHVHQTGGDQRASMREISRCLKPGGSLIVLHFPNRSSWQQLLSRRASSIHDRRFDSAQVDELAAAGGLEIGVKYRYNQLPRNFVRRLKLSRLGDSELICNGLGGSDRLLGKALPFTATNWMFVATKPHSPT